MVRFQPLAQALMFRQAVRDQIDAALMLAPIDNAMAFFFRQCIELSEQRPVQRRRAIGEQVHEHRTASGDFARLKRARALVAFQIEKLKPVREGHSDLIVIA
jgi:hypothetical protein